MAKMTEHMSLCVLCTPRESEIGYDETVETMCEVAYAGPTSAPLKSSLFSHYFNGLRYCGQAVFHC
jgi:hypothetical protein